MQLTLKFEPGLTQQHKTLRSVTQASVLNHRGGVAAVAPDVDMSPSQLGRKLSGNPEDPHRTLDIDDWVNVIQSTGDFTPIYWLIERFLPNDDEKRRAAVDQLSQLMPQIAQLLAQAGGHPPTRGGRR